MSGIEQIRNLIRREIALALNLRGRTKIGLVQSYDPATHSAKVAYQPEGVLSGWLPIATARAGNGAGIHFAPNVGDQVLVHFLEGDRDSGVIGLRLYSTQDQPLNVPAGQMWIQDDKGTFIKLTNDGNAAVGAPGDVTVTVGGNLSGNVSGSASIGVSGNLTITAPTVAIEGDLTVSGTIAAQGDVTGASISLENHVHTGVTAGASLTGPSEG